MIQLNNGFEDYYYLNEDGSIYNAVLDTIIYPDKNHLYKLKHKQNGYKKISVRTIYKSLYNKPFCKDDTDILEGEEWKEIIGTNNYYFVSNMGRIKSLYGYNAIILKPYSNQGGYLRVDIIEDGIRRSKLVHKLTAAAWLPAPPRLDLQLHHIDFDKTNNAASNLEYLTAAIHAKKHSDFKKE